MGYFSLYRKYYKEPERFSPTEARERRLSALLEREQRFAQVPNFQNKLGQLRQEAGALSLAKKLVNESVSQVRNVGPQAASIAAALSRFKESDFADPVKREAYRKLRGLQEAVKYRQDQERAKPSGGDTRRFSPSPYPSTIYGTGARYGLSGRLTPSSSWLPVFHLPWSVVPCIQRAVRREVMFAKGKAGRGYKVRHRWSEFSGIPC